MSADNGIYILKTQAVNPLPESDFEYRVAHGQAIENIYYNVATGASEKDFVPQEAFRYFGDCQVFTTEVEAMLFAHKLAEEYPILEYGVSILDHHNETFVPFSEEEMEFYEGGVDDIIGRHRQKRDAEVAEKRKKAAIPFGEGMTFEPAFVNGYLVREDGTKVHGSLSGLQQLIVTVECGGPDGFGAGMGGEGLDLEFLPTDWNK